MVESTNHDEREDVIGFDPDEDLFDFGEVADEDPFDVESDEDLEEIFAAFQAQDESMEAVEALDLAPASPSVPEAAPTEPAPRPDPVPAAEATPDEEVWEPHPEPAAAARPEPEVLSPPPAVDTLPVFALPEGHSTAPTRPARGPALPTSMLLILIAMTCVNGLIAVLSLRSTAAMHNNVLETGRQITETADEIRGHSSDQAREIADLRLPIAPIDPEQHPTFDLARDHIEAGRYAEARRSLYSLLAVVDRLDESKRKTVESRAQFLLAEALHLEAVKRLEADR